MSKPIVISIEKCYKKYQELNLGRSGFEKRAKSSDESFQNTEQILESFGLKVLPVPKDENGAKKWKSEWKRLQTQYLKMINCQKKRKFIGTFFDSSNYSVFAQVKNANEADDPIYEV